jgi:hypothetical protein
MPGRLFRNQEGRGYGVGHRRLRERLAPLVAAGVLRCVFCGELIEGEFHLDHSDDRRGWRGVAHPLCNLREAGLKSARLRAGRRTVTSRQW